MTNYVSKNSQYRTFVPESVGILSYRHRGSSGFGNIYYPAGHLPAYNSGGNTSVSADYLMAAPFYVPGGGVVDYIGATVYNISSTVAVRFGIYEATSATNIYPGALVVDAGESSFSTTGSKTRQAACTVSGDRLYWLAMVVNDQAPYVTFYRTSVGLGLFGMTALNGTSAPTYVHVTQTYGALPSTFPSYTGASFSTLSVLQYYNLSA